MVAPRSSRRVCSMAFCTELSRLFSMVELLDWWRVPGPSGGRTAICRSVTDTVLARRPRTSSANRPETPGQSADTRADRLTAMTGPSVDRLTWWAVRPASSAGRPHLGRDHSGARVVRRTFTRMDMVWAVAGGIIGFGAGLLLRRTVFRFSVA